MTGVKNKRRRHNRKGRETRSLWAFLFRKESEADDINRTSFFKGQEVAEEDLETLDPNSAPRNIWQEIWRRFNFWSALAAALFLAFVCILATVVVRMWTPQDLDDIRGYMDNAEYKDISASISSARGGPVSFTEAELNAYLKRHCRIRQSGLFSIFAHTQGVAIRIHEGYAEVVIDRVIGANLHQTTAVNVTFTREVENGLPVVKVELQGGPPMFGNLPRGGRIGSLSVPKRHIQVLKPALETLMDCCPEITKAITQQGYLPVFTADRRVELVPFTPNT